MTISDAEIIQGMDAGTSQTLSTGLQAVARSDGPLNDTHIVNVYFADMLVHSHANYGEIIRY